MTAVDAGELTGVAPGGSDEPRRIVVRQSPGDRVFLGSLRAAGYSVLVITGLIAAFLIIKSYSSIARAGWGFLTNETWLPATNKFGVASLVPDGVFIALIALFVAIPVGLASAIFISEFATGAFQRALVALVDLMAAVPSIVYGLWGVYFLQPRLIGTIRWMSEHLSFIPIFQVRGSHDPASFTSSTFLAGIVISLMVIPLVAAISREVYSQTPQGEKEAAFALGASRWGMVRTVVIPYGRGGAIGAIMLGFGRAMGETIVVALILSPTSSVAWRILESHGNSIPALIALHYTESTPQMLSSLLAAGLVLFVLTLIVNAIASVIVTRSRSGAQTGG